LKKTHHKKRAGGVAQGVDPELKPQSEKKKKKGFRIQCVIIHHELITQNCLQIMIKHQIYPQGRSFYKITGYYSSKRKNKA
jgi:hypothetical protein